VAIDGVDAAGKTTLADALAARIELRGRPAARVGADGFLRPRAERYRRGHESPQGYYQDSFDYDSLRSSIEAQAAAEDAVLLVDGIFLMRPELNDLWDFRVFVQVSFDEALRRAVLRDAHLLGSPSDVLRRYRRRYVPGQRLLPRARRPGPPGGRRRRERRPSVALAAPPPVTVSLRCLTPALSPD
jgi:uridine kinase